ncbi:hypothetical protein JIP1600_3150001 [Flavobacterium psychrophilum]|nr:hypothetical protein JIP1600_3150001 [Flavobacterium psychrophilum]
MAITLVGIMDGTILGAITDQIGVGIIYTTEIIMAITTMAIITGITLGITETIIPMPTEEEVLCIQTDIVMKMVAKTILLT